MNSGPILLWPYNCNPRIPSLFRKILETLEDAGEFHLVDTIPNLAGPRITYETSATLGVLDTLAAKEWHKRLASEPQLAIDCAQIIQLLAILEISGKYSKEELVRLSLVARRLLVCSAYGINSSDPLELLKFVTLPTLQLPRAGCLLPTDYADKRPLFSSGNRQVIQFTHDARHFFESIYRYSTTRKLTDEDELESHSFNMLNAVLGVRKVSASSGEEDDELSFEAGSIEFKHYAYGCLAGDLVARNPAQMELAVALIQYISDLNARVISCLLPSEIASWLVLMLALFFGIAPADAFRIQTAGFEVSHTFNFPATLDLKHSRLVLLPGNGYESSLAGRVIQGTSIEVQLHGVMSQLSRILFENSSGNKCLEDFIGAPAVDRFVSSISLRLKGVFRPIHGREMGSQLLRISSANQFVALTFAEVLPAHYALLSGKAPTPWRSDSNYTRVSPPVLQNSIRKIWESLWDLADRNPIGELPELINPGHVGAVVPTASSFSDAFKSYGDTI